MSSIYAKSFREFKCDCPDPHKNYHKYSKYIEKLQNNPNEQYDFKYGQLATHLSDEIFKAYYYSSSGEEHCLYDSEEDNQNHLTQQEINMFNKNRRTMI